MGKIEIKGEVFGSEDSKDIKYNNKDSGLSAECVQDAIDELAEGGGSSALVEKTKEEYDALSTAEKTNGNAYFVKEEDAQEALDMSSTINYIESATNMIVTTSKNETIIKWNGSTGIGCNFNYSKPIDVTNSNKITFELVTRTCYDGTASRDSWDFRIALMKIPPTTRCEYSSTMDVAITKTYKNANTDYGTQELDVSELEGEYYVVVWAIGWNATLSNIKYDGIEKRCIYYKDEVYSGNCNVTINKGNGLDYSTTEQDLGVKWIDGRRIYRIVGSCPDNIDKIIYSNLNTNKNIIPILSSNTGENGSAIVSSCYSGRDAFRAFNKTTDVNSSTTDSWIANAGSLVGETWIGYSFNEPITVIPIKAHFNYYADAGTKYGIQIFAILEDETEKEISDLITFEGGSSSYIVSWIDIELKQLPIKIKEFKLKYMLLEGGSQYVLNPGANSGTYISRLTFETYKIEEDTILEYVKTAHYERYDMSTVTATSWSESSSSTYSIEKMLDNNTATCYGAATASQSGWVKFEIPTSIAAAAYSMTSRTVDANDANVMPKTWTLSGSNDNSTWTVIDTRENIAWSGSAQEQTFKMNNSTKYKYYKLDFTELYSSANYMQFSMAIFNLYTFENE